MSVTMLIIASVALIAVCVVAIVVSFRRNGRIAQRISTAALTSEKVRSALASDDAMSYLDANPQIIDDMLARRGADEATRAAVRDFATLPREQRMELIAQGLRRVEAEGGIDEAVSRFQSAGAAERDGTQSKPPA